MTEGKGTIKPHRALSIWALLARCSIFKIFAVFTVMVLMEAACVYGYLEAGQGRTPAEVISGSRISLIFFGALGLVLFILARSQGVLREKSGSAMGRLGLSNRRIFCLQAVYNMLCLWMLFMVQIWAAIGLVRLCGERIGGSVPASFGLFLTFYQSDFLHCLLPMAETGKWVRNLFLLAALSLGAAGGMGKRGYAVLNLLFVVTAVWFVSPIGINFLDLVCMLVYGGAIAMNLWRQFHSHVQ